MARDIGGLGAVSSEGGGNADLLQNIIDSQLTPNYPQSVPGQVNIAPPTSNQMQTARGGALSVLGSMPEEYARVKGIEASEGAKAKDLLQQRMEAMQGYKPDDLSKYLAMAQGFLSPTKSGRFGENVANVAGGLAPIVSEEQKLKEAYKQKALEIAQQNAQQNAVLAAQQRQKMMDDVTKMAQLKASQGIVLDNGNTIVNYGGRAYEVNPHTGEMVERVQATKTLLGADTEAKAVASASAAAIKQAIAGGVTDPEELRSIGSEAGQQIIGNIKVAQGQSSLQQARQPQVGIAAPATWVGNKDKQTLDEISRISDPDERASALKAYSEAKPIHEKALSKPEAPQPSTTVSSIISNLSTQGASPAQPEAVKAETLRTKKYLEGLQTKSQDANELVNITNRTVTELDKIGNDAGKMASIRAGMAAYKLALFPEAATDRDRELAGSATPADKYAFQLATGQVKGISARPSQLEFMKSLENTINKGMTPEARNELASSMLEKAKAVQDEQKAVNEAKGKLKYHQLADFGDRYSEVRASEVAQRTETPPIKMFPIGGKMVQARFNPKDKTYYVQNPDKTWSPVQQAQ